MHSNKRKITFKSRKWGPSQSAAAKAKPAPRVMTCKTDGRNHVSSVRLVHFIFRFFMHVKVKEVYLEHVCQLLPARVSMHCNRAFKTPKNLSRGCKICTMLCVTCNEGRVNASECKHVD